MLQASLLTVGDLCSMNSKCLLKFLQDAKTDYAAPVLQKPYNADVHNNADPDVSPHGTISAVTCISHGFGGLGYVFRSLEMALSVQSAYRKILKAVKKHVTTETTKSHFKDFVADEFRKNANLPPAVAQKKVLLARDYASLVVSVHHHRDLLLSYNIGVDRAAEQVARLRDTARRVGLQLPEEYKEVGRSLNEQKDSKLQE